MVEAESTSRSRNLRSPWPNYLRVTDSKLCNHLHQGDLRPCPPQAIQKGLAQSATYLPLHLRPGDPLSHPIFGEKKKAKGLLLKVSRNNHRDQPSDPDAHNHCASVTVVGMVTTFIQFGGMADFQYVSQDPRPPVQQVTSPTAFRDCCLTLPHMPHMLCPRSAGQAT